ncbi:unnamed protein product [Clonostachys rosea]|uniref:Uncharacterized protein n=1 Tax=Bionectria ochroleuca TaxID=29856 RepID=A0ABY6U850_BIOOC|nr:unnamed protein product [Clonostachys rosea]
MDCLAGYHRQFLAINCDPTYAHADMGLTSEAIVAIVTLIANLPTVLVLFWGLWKKLKHRQNPRFGKNSSLSAL